jgi:hypothetical protein
MDLVLVLPLTPVRKDFGVGELQLKEPVLMAKKSMLLLLILKA